MEVKDLAMPFDGFVLALKVDYNGEIHNSIHNSALLIHLKDAVLHFAWQA